MSSKRLNVLLGGQYIISSTKYSFQPTDRVCVENDDIDHSLLLQHGSSGVYDLRGHSKVSLKAVDDHCIGQLCVHLSKVDAWQEVEVPHPNPFASKSHTVEVFHSNRTITVRYNNEPIAQSSSFWICFEKGGKNYPLRYYIPTSDVHMDLLQRTDLSTHCPFKGDASYYSIKRDGGENLVWEYPGPWPEKVCAPLKDTVCFYLEKNGFEVDISGGDIPYPDTFRFD